MSNYKSQINPVQQSSHPHGLKTEYIVIPSQSAPSFGAQFTIFLNQTSLFLHDIVLNFNTNAVQATTSSGGSFINNSPRLNPSPFWLQKVEIKMGSHFSPWSSDSIKYLHATVINSSLY